MVTHAFRLMIRVMKAKREQSSINFDFKLELIDHIALKSSSPKAIKTWSQFFPIL